MSTRAAMLNQIAYLTPKAAALEAPPMLWLRKRARPYTGRDLPSGAPSAPRRATSMNRDVRYAAGHMVLVNALSGFASLK
ncbi:hypothetical protein [Ahniella affigens]|uniref:hypothetical protein n=1 Tax=Ahniella affigens TaxID=2021234 RepID=UPI0011B1E9AA|nr:hypothetical protein [Ahniella affigens]